jgi:hypothetical protein
MRCELQMLGNAISSFFFFSPLFFQAILNGY